VVHHLCGLSLATRASVLGALSALFIVQALRRYEDQLVFAFLLALAGMALSWFAFTSAAFDRGLKPLDDELKAEGCP
jgi:hypothetical protein